MRGSAPPGLWSHYATMAFKHIGDIKENACLSV